MDVAKMGDSFSAYRKSVYGWAYRVVGNHADALDVTQDVFIKWWRAHHEQSPPANAVGWLRRVTINHSLNLCKTRARLRPLVEINAKDAEPPSAGLERRELAGVVADAMGAMSEHQRSVLFAKLYDGCTFAEIAAQMDLAVPTVKTHYLRALRAARRRIIEAGLMAGDQS